MTSLFAQPRFVTAPVVISWQAFHEAGHVVTAAVLGCPVLSTKIHGGGGSTFASGDPRDMLLIALGGHAAEYVLDVRDLDIRCSASDYKKAFECAIEVARHEERTVPGRKDPGAKLPQGKRAPKAAARAVRALSPVSVAEVEAGAAAVAERVAARWVARAHVLVDAAEVEVRELLDGNRRALRLIAERLETNQHLDAVDIIAIADEARLHEYEREEAQ